MEILQEEKYINSLIGKSVLIECIGGTKFTCIVEDYDIPEDMEDGFFSLDIINLKIIDIGDAKTEYFSVVSTGDIKSLKVLEK